MAMCLMCLAHVSPSLLPTIFGGMSHAILQSPLREAHAIYRRVEFQHRHFLAAGRAGATWHQANYSRVPYLTYTCLSLYIILLFGPAKAASPSAKDFRGRHSGMV